MRKKLNRQDIYTRLGRDELAIGIGIDFQAKARPYSPQSARRYLYELNVPFLEVITANDYDSYDDHFIMIFAPVHIIENSLVIRDLESQVSSLSYAENNTLVKQFRRSLANAERKQINFIEAYQACDKYIVPSVVFIFDNIKGDINLEGNYPYMGVFYGIPRNILTKE